MSLYTKRYSVDLPTSKDHQSIIELFVEVKQYANDAGWCAEVMRRTTWGNYEGLWFSGGYETKEVAFDACKRHLAETLEELTAALETAELQEVKR